MSTANTPPSSPLQQLPLQQLIEQRLDAIDQALMGLLPRADRRAAVTHVETQIRDAVAACPAITGNLPTPAQGLNPPDSASSPLAGGISAFQPHPQLFGLLPGGQMPLTQKRRSRLAISAGVLGGLALALLLAIPVTYMAVEVMGEVLGEFISIGLLGVHTVAVAIGGLAAVGLGIAALLSLRRHRENLVGHGWAIAGLCTGPLPMLLGSAAVLFLVLQTGLLAFFTSSECTDTCVADSPSEPSNGSGPVPAYLPPGAEQPPQDVSCQPPVCYDRPATVKTSRVHRRHLMPEMPRPPASPVRPLQNPVLSQPRRGRPKRGCWPWGQANRKRGSSIIASECNWPKPTRRVRSQLRLAAGEGLVVTEVLPESPAAMAGLQNHDVLTKLDGKRLTKIEAVNAQIQEIRDRKVSVSLFRGGSEITCDVTPRLTTEPSFTVSFVGNLDGSIRLQQAGPGAAQFVVEFTSEPPAQEAAQPTAAEQLVILKTHLAEVHKSLAALEAALHPAAEEKK